MRTHQGESDFEGLAGTDLFWGTILVAIGISLACTILGGIWLGYHALPEAQTDRFVESIRDYLDPK